MSNHTPGPWVIKDDGSYEDAILIAAERKGWSKASQPAKIAMVGDNVWWDDERVEEEDRANARLISAAPQLLEALEAYHAWMTAHFDDVAEMFWTDTGIMAPGKSQPMHYDDGIDDTERRQRWDAWLKERKAKLNEQARAAIAAARGEGR